MKSLLGKSLMDRKEEQNELLLQLDETLDQIWKLDEKLNIIVKATTDLDFYSKHHNHIHGQEVPMISTSNDDTTI